jgi:hypothetical protein
MLIIKQRNRKQLLYSKYPSDILGSHSGEGVDIGLLVCKTVRTIM